MKITGIHHIQVMSPVGSEDTARYFYGEILELQEIEKPDTLKPQGGTWYAAGDQQLHISIDKDFTPQRSRRHFALLAEDLNDLRRRLARYGIDYQDDTRFLGFDRFYVKDPFGNRIEILEPVEKP